MRLPLITCVLALGLQGCATEPGHEQTGQVAGALLGAVLGVALGKNTDQRIAGALIGAGAGGLLGGAIGRQLDARDRAMAQSATRVAVQHPPGTTVEWTSEHNPGVRGIVRTEPDYTAQGTCRTMRHEVTVDGRDYREDTRVCQRPDGSWVVA